MSQGVEVVGLYVRDQNEALTFYVEKLGFRVHTDVRNGDYRWLTVQHPDAQGFGLAGSGVFVINPPFTLHERLLEVLPWLVDVLGQVDDASYLLEQRPA